MSVNVTLNFSLLVYFDVDRHGGLLNFKKGYPGLIFWHSINPRRQADLSEWGSGLIYKVVERDWASCLLRVHWVYWFMRGAGGSWVNVHSAFNTSLNPTVAPDLLNKMTKRGGTKQTAFIIIFWSYLHLLLTKHGMWRNLNVFLKCNRTDMFHFISFTGFFSSFFPTHICLWLPQPRLHVPSQSRHGARCIWCSTLAVLSL